ncbi:MAG: PA2779 family protein [Bdellovibrionales bacterium]|nr:PA2779 family protein [Bdellovibrionales bacterium]
MKSPVRLVAIFMAFIMTNIPYLAWAETAKEMIPTAAVVEELSRAEAQAKVQEILSRTEVRSELLKRGVSVEEVNSRMASLSDSELRQLAGQMDAAMYGGDVVGILVVVLLVLLIIYLAKRI